MSQEDEDKCHRAPSVHNILGMENNCLVLGR
jgi:hypothetical protein